MCGKIRGAPQAKRPDLLQGGGERAGAGAGTCTFALQCTYYGKNCVVLNRQWQWST